MTKTMATLANTPEAPAIAARFGVPSAIHACDFMFMFHLGPDPDQWPETRARAIDYYFSDGAQSATRLAELIARFHPDHGQRTLRVLEFASGYGMVSRHIARMNDRLTLTACDIHEEAVAFQERELCVEAVLSSAEPEALRLSDKFDVVFALSFFSHIPHRTFGRWLQRLSHGLADNGLLIFTTHGRGAYERAGRPPFRPEGFWFHADSEQKDLPAEDYGTMLVSPFYAFEQIERCEQAEIVHFEAASWWGDQDTYIARKVLSPLRIREPRNDQLSDENNALRETIDAIYSSRSWRMTAPARRLRRIIRGAP